MAYIRGLGCTLEPAIWRCEGGFWNKLAPVSPVKAVKISSTGRFQYFCRFHLFDTKHRVGLRTPAHDTITFDEGEATVIRSDNCFVDLADVCRIPHVILELGKWLSLEYRDVVTISYDEKNHLPTRQPALLITLRLMDVSSCLGLTEFTNNLAFKIGNWYREAYCKKFPERDLARIHAGQRPS